MLKDMSPPMMTAKTRLGILVMIQALSKRDIGLGAHRQANRAVRDS